MKKPCVTLLASVNCPAMSPRGLIAIADVDLAPAMSICVQSRSPRPAPAIRPANAVALTSNIITTPMNGRLITSPFFQMRRMLPRGGMAIGGRSSRITRRSFRVAVLDCQPSILEPAMSIAASAVRFDRFEADLRSRELRSGGSKVALQDQPFRVLELLLAARGEIVTREEL